MGHKPLTHTYSVPSLSFFYLLRSLFVYFYLDLDFNTQFKLKCSYSHAARIQNYNRTSLDYLLSSCQQSHIACINSGEREKKRKRTASGQSLFVTSCRCKTRWNGAILWFCGICFFFRCNKWDFYFIYCLALAASKYNPNHISYKIYKLIRKFSKLFHRWNSNLSDNTHNNWSISTLRTY